MIKNEKTVFGWGKKKSIANTQEKKITRNQFIDPINYFAIQLEGVIIIRKTI